MTIQGQIFSGIQTAARAVETAAQRAACRIGAAANLVGETLFPGTADTTAGVRMPVPVGLEIEQVDPQALIARRQVLGDSGGNPGPRHGPSPSPFSDPKGVKYIRSVKSKMEPEIGRVKASLNSVLIVLGIKEIPLFSKARGAEATSLSAALLSVFGLIPAGLFAAHLVFTPILIVVGIVGVVWGSSSYVSILAEKRKAAAEALDTLTKLYANNPQFLAKALYDKYGCRTAQKLTIERVRAFSLFATTPKNTLERLIDVWELIQRVEASVAAPPQESEQDLIAEAETAQQSLPQDSRMYDFLSVLIPELKLKLDRYNRRMEAQRIAQGIIEAKGVDATQPGWQLKAQQDLGKLREMSFSLSDNKDDQVFVAQINRVADYLQEISAKHATVLPQTGGHVNGQSASYKLDRREFDRGGMGTLRKAEVMGQRGRPPVCVKFLALREIVADAKERYEHALEESAEQRLEIERKRKRVVIDRILRFVDEYQFGRELGQHLNICSVHDTNIFMVLSNIAELRKAAEVDTLEDERNAILDQLDLTQIRSLKLFMVHDFLARGSETENLLDFRIRERRAGHRIDEEGAARLLLPAFKAVAWAHQRHGAVHRDLCSKNVCLIDKDGRVIPVLIDFGLARFLLRQAMTAAQDFLGQISHMPPMVYQKHAKAKGDIYSAGILLAELILGENPVMKMDRDLRHKHLFKTPQELNLEGIREPYRSILARALSPRPENNYGSMDEFIEALAAALAGDNELALKIASPLVSIPEDTSFEMAGPVAVFAPARDQRVEPAPVLVPAVSPEDAEAVPQLQDAVPRAQVYPSDRTIALDVADIEIIGDTEVEELTAGYVVVLRGGEREDS